MSEADLRRAYRQMKRLEELRLHSLAGGSFYEPVERRPINDDYEEIVRSLLPTDWQLVRDSIWLHMVPPRNRVPPYGWKIHVSSVLADAPRTLTAVVPLVATAGVAAKFAADPTFLRMVNSREWDRGGSGKFITIYLVDSAQCGTLLAQLARRLTGACGPYVLSDRRFRDAKTVFYRYGGMRPRFRLSYDGRRVPVLVAPDGSEWEDRRLPRFQMPPWVTADPFLDPDRSESPTASEKAGSLTLNHGRYRILRPRHFSSSGGVYLAHDRSRDTDVVIKEARPHVDDDPFGNDAITLRKNEWKVLRHLTRTALVPEGVEFFQEWEHYFLVREFVGGQPLSQLTPVPPPPGLAAAEEYTTIRGRWVANTTVAEALIRAVETVHDHGIVLGDLSPTNILITGDGRVMFIDLDAATFADSERAIPLFTHGFQRPNRKPRATPEDDRYALGCLLMTLSYPMTELMSWGIPPERFLRELESDYGLQFPWAPRIRPLLGLTPPDDDPPFDQPTILAATLVADAPPVFRAATSDEVRSVLPQIISAIMASATLDRRDRLFPADPAQRNPLEVSHGALGVLRVVNRVTGSVADHHLDWVLSHRLSPHEYPPGLYHGLSGIAWALWDLRQYDEARASWEIAVSHPLRWSDLFVEDGAAGIGLASLYLFQQTAEARYLNEAVAIGDGLSERVNSGANAAWSTPEGVRYLGYTRGAAGARLFFLYLYLATRREDFLDIGRIALQSDLDAALTQPGGYRSFGEEPTSSLGEPYWRFGSAGVLTALIRYVAITKDPDLMNQFRLILPDIQRKYTKFPGLFSGLAGLGNALLDASHILGDQECGAVAWSVARGILLQAVRRDSGTYFPGEFSFRLSMDLGTGSAGIALFLHRLLTGVSNSNFVPDGLLHTAGNPPVSLRHPVG